MQRVFHDEEDQKLVRRWLLINVIAYSTVALMIVMLAALPGSPDAKHAGLEGLSGPAPSFYRGGLHMRSQTYATVETRPEPTVFAHR